MPQPTQHYLIHILLLWITVISIIQVVFIVVYFTAGQSHNRAETQTDPSTMPHQEHSTPSPPSNDNLCLDKGKMVTFKATQAIERPKYISTVKWAAKNPNPGMVSQAGDVLTIQKDGYYFLNLQVTLSSCKESSDHTVSLKWENEVVMEGRINTKTLSTGVLSKVEELSAGGTLVVNINPPAACFNDSESVTHLDIIYMAKD